MSQDQTLGKRIAQDGFVQVVAQLVVQAVTSPTALSVVGAAVPLAVARMTPVPLPYLATCCALVFMALMVGTRSFLQLRFERNPEGKLAFGGAGVGQMLAPEDGDKPRKVEKISYAIIVVNKAQFPIEYRLDPVRVTLGAHVNPNPMRSVTGGITAGGETQYFQEAAIDLPATAAGQTVEGDYQFVIWYGRPGKLKYKLPKKLKAHLRFHADGRLDSGQIGDF